MIITCPNCTTRYSLPQDKIKPGGQKVRCAKCGTVWHQVPEEEPLAPAAEEQVPVPPAPPEPAWAPAMPAEPEPSAAPPVDASPEPPEPPPVTPEPALAPAAEPPAEPAAPPPQAEPPDSFAQFHVSSSAEAETSGTGRKVAIAVVILVILALAALVVFRQQVQDLTGIQLMSTTAAPAQTQPAAADTPAAPLAPKAPEPMTLTLEDVESYTEETEGIKRLVVKGVVSNFGDREQVVPKISFELRDKAGNQLDLWVFDPPQARLGPHLKIKFEKSRELPPQALYDLNPAFYDEANPPAAMPPAAGTAPVGGQPAQAPAPKPVAPVATKPAQGATPRPVTVPPAAARPPASQQTPAPTE